MTEDKFDNQIVCGKCGAARVAKSHSKNMDFLVMQLLPKRPYRCLQCYQRFWLSEPFFVNRGRVFTWLVILVVIAGLGVWQNQRFNQIEQPEPFSDFGSAPNAVTGEPPVDLASDLPAVQPVVVGDAVTSDSVDDQANRPIDEAVSNNGLAPALEPTELADNTASSPAAVLEEQYTTEQLQQRLVLAKAKAEQAELDNRQRQAQLKRTVASERDELRSLYKVDINYRIDQWRKAWEVGLVDDYLNCYSERFTPGGDLTREQWVKQRKRRVRPSKKIDLQLANFEVEFSDNDMQSTVSFDQVYQSGSYRDESRKQLVLRKEGEEWKITSETEVTE